MTRMLCDIKYLVWKWNVCARKHLMCANFSFFTEQDQHPDQGRDHDQDLVHMKERIGSGRREDVVTQDPRVFRHIRSVNPTGKFNNSHLIFIFIYFSA